MPHNLIDLVSRDDERWHETDDGSSGVDDEHTTFHKGRNIGRGFLFQLESDHETESPNGPYPLGRDGGKLFLEVASDLTRVGE